MDAALGPPEKMAERRDDLTPMMSQYYELCERYDDALVLFQVGDFYEAFCEAAEAISRLLEITLTKREDSTGTYPMAGIPIDSAESYVETLLDAGYRIAIADQVQDPDEVTGVVDRAVTRIVTPGTLTEDELLDTDDNNFVAALTRGESERGLSLLDVSTGEFYATAVDSDAALRDEISRFAPEEAILGPEASGDPFPDGCMVTPHDARTFEYEAAADRVAAYFGDPDALLASDAEIRACGALLSYAEYTRGGRYTALNPDVAPTDDEDDTAEDPAAGTLDYINRLTRYDPREYMVLDRVAIRSLELFERRTVHDHAGPALIDVLDETSCALGSRALKDWLRRPLIDREEITARHDAVEELVGSLQRREAASELLRDVYDVERLIARVSRGRANARDLRSLKDTLDVVPELRAALDGVDCDRLWDVRERLDEMGDVRELIGSAIREDPPIEVTEGGVIREGYSDELDDLRATEHEGKQWIDDLEARERERTGVDSLKVGHNSVHGYYIEVTNPNLDAVPDDYQRRQTLKNSERFYTPELKEREDEIFRAERRADDLEYDLFREVRSSVADEAARVQALAETLAELDALVSLATVAAQFDYSRPEFGGDGIRIETGRHPVVERTEERFVPNDTSLDPDADVAILTGPNMSGKSTYMRQVALIVVLAQLGSFVPAERAELRLVDRVFTRVGASDDIASGKSTFMVEMTELAEILDSATERSLVLLDEVGRGTSTADGLAIARAVTEHLHDEVGATTLFATHHHDLTGIAADLDRVRNLHFAARREDGDVQFDHQLSSGPATASYGVEVAKMAGVPDAVVDRARTLLADDAASEAGSSPTANAASDADPTADPAETDSGVARQAVGDGAGGTAEDVPPAVAATLRDINLADTTPLEALQLLDELQRRLDD
jgi:DNA mismatch repair protein MutS